MRLVTSREFADVKNETDDKMKGSLGCFAGRKARLVSKVTEDLFRDSLCLGESHSESGIGPYSV